MTGTVLILGASGRFGRNAAEAFWNAGWRVHLFDRSADDLSVATKGVDVIVNGWNPAYPDWAAAMPALTSEVIAAARSAGATVLIPGNVYVFGADAPAAFGPDVPHRATNPLGRIRRDMEEAYRRSGVRTIILRAGDFLDTEASGNWFDMQMAPSLASGKLTYPGDPNVPHAWAFLPDLARAAVALAEKRAELPQFVDVAFPGYTLSGQELALICGEVLNKSVEVRRMAWWPLHIARPFWRMAGPLLEMRYLWSKPHFLKLDSIDTWLPGFVDTDVKDALGAAITPVLKAKAGQPKRGGGVPSPVQAQ